MSKMSQPIRALGGHICWPIGTKNTNLVEDLEYLLPVRFREILCSGCRGDVENVSGNQSPRWPYLLTDRHQKHKLGRGPWVLASCKVWWNSVLQLQRRCRNVSANQSPRRPYLLTYRHEKYKLCRGPWVLASYKFHEILCNSCGGKVQTCQPIWALVNNICWLIGTKNIN